MKVRCVRLLDSRGASLEHSPWLTLGKTYEVLSLFFSKENGMQLRLIGDGGNGLAIFKLEEFEIVSDTMPATWVMHVGPKGTIQFAPKSWTQGGFWERYYERDPDAIRIFDEERGKILAMND